MQSGILQAGIRSGISGRRRMIRTVAFVLLFCIVIFLLLSEAYVFSYANHKHNHYGIGGTCTLCALFHSAEHLLKQLGINAAYTSFGQVHPFAGIIAVYFAFCVFRSCTPVQKKTRLNN